MKSFIKEFYYGNIDPQARNTQKNGRIQKQMTVLSVNEERLLNKLPEEDKSLFLDYVNAWDEVLGHCDTESFYIGFRLGAQFAYDAFVGETEF